MGVKITYKRQVDAFCNEKNTMTAEEMLQIVKERMSGWEHPPENATNVIELTEQNTRQLPKRPAVWGTIKRANPVRKIVAMLRRDFRR